MLKKADFYDEDAEPRYALVAQWAHWLTVLLISAAVIVAWIMAAEARDNPSRPDLFTLHKALGVTIFAIAAFRILWRAVSNAPPLTGRVAAWEAALAKITHLFLYLVLIAMPVTGFIMSQAGGHPISFFYLFDLPTIIPENKNVGELAEEAHLWLQWVLYALVAFHVLGVTWHVYVRRDGALHRMLPRQVNAE
ncbi:cytochrome b [Methylocapsa acidiphila]|uniref:cytochrome b n=1 Tax=Methylocapsa acidiphila TaxID=133552 RepID=UPI00041D7B60|nr:cytochrome b [Methylocapsa acidiphila]